jgi:hypothetical protein
MNELFPYFARARPIVSEFQAIAAADWKGWRAQHRMQLNAHDARPHSFYGLSDYDNLVASSKKWQRSCVEPAEAMRAYQVDSPVR